jgi:hypothetical protein
MEPMIASDAFRPRSWTPLLLALALAAPGASEAALGPEFEISDRGSQADVAIDGAGNFAVVWVERAAFARFYAASGVPLGSKLLLSASAGQFSIGPRVAANRDGDFVTVWAAIEPATSASATQRIRAQRFDRRGRPVGIARLVSSMSAPVYENRPAVGIDGLGRFVVAWEVDGQIWARRFDRSGVPDSAERRIDTDGDSLRPGITTSPEGDALITWSTRDGGQLVAAGLARLFDGQGEPLGPELRLDPCGGQSSATSSFVDGRGTFTVLLFARCDGQLTLRSQQIGPSGTLIGDAVALLPAETDPDSPPVHFAGADIGGASDGRFLLAWGSLWEIGSDDDDGAVRARAWASEGSPISPVVRVNQVTWAFQEFPAVAATPDGALVVVWESEDPIAETSAIRARRGALPRLKSPRLN